jgi:membrane protein YqaA with SNARE-associated domain
MDALLTPEAGLAGLFLHSLLAATLLPGGSELALFAYLAAHPERAGAAVALATVGNTMGGLTSWACGRFLPKWQRLATVPHIDRLRRHGNAALFFAWLPLAGDLLCVAAGWLRTDWRGALVWLALGKLTRYLVVAQGALWL